MQDRDMQDHDMQDRDMQRRREWALALIHRLEEANHSLEALSEAYDTESGTALEEARRQAEAAVEAKRSLRRQRVDELKECLTAITGIMNDWNTFRNDPAAQRRWSYPILLTRKGHDAETKRKALYERIQSIILQNRLLDDDIRRMSDSVQRTALTHVRESGGHAAWQESLSQRKQLLDDLCLVLASMPETACCDFDPALPGDLVRLLA